MKEDEKREFYKGLRERIKQLRMEHLFEEPCPLYEEDEENESVSVNCLFITNSNNMDSDETQFIVVLSE